MRNSRPVLILLVLILTTLACGVGGSTPSKQATLDAISAQVRGTGTASSVQGSQPTQPAGNVSSDSLTATAAAFAPILAELPKYGVDPSEGHMGWVHPPVSLDASGYHHFEYVNNFLGTLATDFVISADITWNTVGSTSGCGFVLRSDGNELALDQYVAILTRVAQGHFLFATMSDGDVVTGQDFYPRTKDKSFDWQNDATNRLTLVGRGNHFWVYTNGILVGEVDPSKPPPGISLPPEPEKPANQGDAQAMAEYRAQMAEYDASVQILKAEYAARQRAFNSAETVFERGFTAMVALSESGRTTNCKFDNAWLFLIDSP